MFTFSSHLAQTFDQGFLLRGVNGKESAGMPSIPSGVLPDAEGVATLDGVWVDRVGAKVDGLPVFSATEAGDGAVKVVGVCAAGSCAGRAAAPG